MAMTASEANRYGVAPNYPDAISPVDPTSLGEVVDRISGALAECLQIAGGINEKISGPVPQAITGNAGNAVPQPPPSLSARLATIEQGSDALRTRLSSLYGRI